MLDSDCRDFIMDERRSEPRIDVKAPVVMTPLATVTTRLSGHVVNVSGRGLKVRVDGGLNGKPASGEVYRVQTGDDLMLCEVRNWQLEGEGAAIGFQILHWGDLGELNRVIKTLAASCPS
jgi:hypothetical protein